MNTTNDKPEALQHIARCREFIERARTENGGYEGIEMPLKLAAAKLTTISETTAAQHAEIQRLRIEREAMLEQIADLGGEVREPELQEIRARRDEIQRLTSEMQEQCRIIGMSGERELALRAEIQRLTAEMERLRADKQGLIEAMRDEIDEGLRLRELGGAAPDENITAMTERVIRERDALRARIAEADGRRISHTEIRESETENTAPAAEPSGHVVGGDGGSSLSHTAALESAHPVGTPVYIGSAPDAGVPDGWQPIETAPTELGLYLVRIGDQTHIAQFNPNTVTAKWWTAYGLPDRLRNVPTHWMPLPAAPKQAEGGEA